MIVTDASVLLKCFFYEEDSAAAFSLVNQHRYGLKTIKVPDLLLYEVTNILTVKSRVPLEKISEALEIIYSLSLDIYPLGKEDFFLAAELSKNHQISVYDAAYLVLAINLDCPFITADKKLYKNTHTLEKVVLLSDFIFQEEL